LKFTTERDNFADAVAWVSRTVSTRPTLPVLGGTLLELEGQRLRLVSTDLENTGEAVIEVRGEADGRVVVPGRIFGDVVRNLPTGLVEVEAGDGGLEVRRGQITSARSPVRRWPARPPRSGAPPPTTSPGRC
jgi:DNA polymerase-3 subunit beta